MAAGADDGFNRVKEMEANLACYENSEVEENLVDFVPLEYSAVSGIVNRTFADELSYARLRELLRDAAEQCEPAKSGQGPRLGRGTVMKHTLPSGRTIVIRCCLRGGMMQLLMHRSFLRFPFLPLPCLRPISETLCLSDLAAAGVRVPLPVAGIIERTTSGLAYRGYVVTAFIPEARNFLEMVLACRGGNGDQEVLNIARRAGEEAKKMLAAGIFHRDLHLGNILVGREGEVFLIDFDKVKRFKTEGKFNRARRKLMCRWKKSLRKHLGESMLARGLEEQFGRGLI